MRAIEVTAPVHALQVILTCTERGWNAVVLHDGVALRTDDPLDVPSAEQAISMALDALRSCWSVKSEVNRADKD